PAPGLPNPKSIPVSFPQRAPFRYGQPFNFTKAGRSLDFAVAQAQDEWLMATMANEAQKVCPCNIRRRGILQWMAVDRLELHQPCVDYGRHLVGHIVDKREYGNRTRQNSQNLL